jgi:hypothetical protein
MSISIICSGLGWQAPCAKRDQYANYKHWATQLHSEFNACTSNGEEFKFFTRVSVVQPSASVARTQQEPFS